MPYNLPRLTLSEMIECGATLRRLGRDAPSMEAASTEIVQWLYRNLHDGEGRPACPLVRLYKTHELGGLPEDLKAFVRDTAGEELPPSTRCLTLLATAGDEVAWNDRSSSRGHRAIPLRSAEAIRQLPMILQLVRQLGFEESQVVAPDERLMLEATGTDFKVFYVPEALNSPHIPAQSEFVEPYGIRSVLGFGGLLPPAELYSLILFSREPIEKQTVELFKPLSLNVRMALLPLVGGRVFT